jgi:hypothetical protein
MKLKVAALFFSLCACGWSQGRAPVARAAPPPARLPGSITNTDFARSLGESIQGRPTPPNPAKRLFNPYFLSPPVYGGYPAFYYIGVPVVINQTFVSPDPGPQVNEQPDQQPEVPEFTAYQAPPEQPPVDASGTEPPASNSVLKPTLYLISMKNGAVRTAVAYWYEGSSLHYVGKDRQMHEVAIADVDADASRQLNSERGIDFHIPD